MGGQKRRQCTDRAGNLCPTDEPTRDRARPGRAADQGDRCPRPRRTRAYARTPRSFVPVRQGARELGRGPRTLYGARTRIRHLMQWQDVGFFLGATRHGGRDLLPWRWTRERGRHAGLVRGGQSPKARAMLQPGNEVAATWRGRLDEHLGTIGCELVRAYA